LRSRTASWRLRARNADRAAGQALGVQRALQQHGVAQLLQDGGAAGRARAGLLGRQHQERQVGPGRLVCNQLEQGRQVRPGQRLLGHDDGAAVLDPGYQRRKVAERRGCDADAGQDLGDHLRIAPARRQDQDGQPRHLKRMG